MTPPCSVAVVGGGLAGLAAAVRLRQAGCRVELFEARRRLGGRASSFRDPASGQLVDFCQHVSMGCCTNLDDFCRRAGIADCFQAFDTLHFFSGGRRYDLRPSRALPAPLHLLPALARLNYLSIKERARLARALLRLARTSPEKLASQPAMDWLVAAGQSRRAIEGFWEVVLVSALGETLGRVSAAAARKVFVDGFLACAGAYKVLVPTLPLGELYGTRLESRLAELGVELHLNTPVEQVARGVATANAGPSRRLAVLLPEPRTFDAVVVATDWRHVELLLAPELRAAVPELNGAARLESSPITGIHLWFDRQIVDLPHAVLVGRLSQWLFYRGAAAPPPTPRPPRTTPHAHYYQVVVSASRSVAELGREEVLRRVCVELGEVFPAAREAKLLHGQVVTEKHAVFSPLPGSEALRPPQCTPLPGFALAGDWTATGWPATMEGAVRSGYLAAQAVLESQGRHEPLLAPDLTRGRLARWMLGG